MAGNAGTAILVACSDGVEGRGRQQAPEQNRDVSGDRDVIARLRPPALYRVGEFGRDRLRPKLESLAAACLKPRDPRAISLAMRRAFEMDVAAIGLESMLEKARSDRTRLDQRHADASSFELETERIGESLDGEFRGAIGAAVRRRRPSTDEQNTRRPPPFDRSRDHARGEVMPAEHGHLE